MRKYLVAGEAASVVPPQPIELFVAMIIIMAVNAVVSRLVRRSLEMRIPELQWLTTSEARSNAIQRAAPLLRIVSSTTCLCFAAVLISLPLQIAAHYLLRLNNISMGLFLAGYVVVLVLLALLISSLGAGRIRRQLRYQLANRGMPLCRICGYDLSGQEAARCPECGHECDAGQLPGNEVDLSAPVSIAFDYSDDVLNRGLAVLWARVHGRKLLWGTTTSVALLLFLIPACGNHWLVGAIGCLTVLSSFQLLRGRAMFTRRVIADWQHRPSRHIAVEFDNSGFGCTTTFSTMRVAWNQCRRLWRGKHVWLLFVTDSEPVLLPAHLLGDDIMAFITTRMHKAGVEVT